MILSILYRGSLSSCNYSCVYCPFAKTENTAEELKQDQTELESFTAWLENLNRPVQLLFTPWGEALHHRYYQQALCQISHMPHVKKAAIQTNLAAGLNWIPASNTNVLAFWSTFHPSQVSRKQFLKRVRQVAENGNRISAGVVGLKEHFDEIEALKNELPAQVRLWINAYKREPQYYLEKELQFLESLDQTFPVNNR